MGKSRFTESQIVNILKQVEGGRQVKEACREYGISGATYYNWKSKYGGMEATTILTQGAVSNNQTKKMIVCRSSFTFL